LMDGGLFVKIGAIKRFCNGVNRFIEGITRLFRKYTSALAY
jgi:hypothetical protein